MRLYSTKAESTDILRYGRRLKKGLMRFAQTRGLAAALDAPQAALAEAEAATKATEAPLDDASDDLKFAELDAEALVRRVWSRARELDGDRNGPITLVGFPNGVTVVIAPKGSGQKRTLVALRKAYAESNAPELAPHREEILAKCDEALAVFTPAFDAWEAAAAANASAFATEKRRRVEHRRTVDALFGGLREALPGDRKLQDAIVPRGGEREAEEPEPAPPTS